MKNTFKIQLLASLLMLFAGASRAQNGIVGNKNIQHAERHVPAFHSIEKSGSVDLVLVAASEQTVTVIAESNIQQYVKTEVENGVLRVYLKAPRVSSRRTHKLEVVVATNRLKSLSSNGSGDVESRGILRLSALQVNHNGSGDLDLHLHADALDLNKEGSGDVTVEGTFKALKIRAGSSGDIELTGSADKMVLTKSGSGDLEAGHFKVVDLTISNSGSGDAEIWAEGTLSMTNSGSGDIEYAGKAKITQSVKNGSGDIERD